MASGDNSSLRVEQRKVPYLTTRDGWLKLAVVLDLAARRVIGWAMRHTMAGELTRGAIASCDPARVARRWGSVDRRDRSIRVARPTARARGAALLCGPAGVGKTHLSVALGMEACRLGLRVAFTTAAALITTLGKALYENRL